MRQAQCPVSAMQKTETAAGLPAQTPAQAPRGGTTDDKAHVALTVTAQIRGPGSLSPCWLLSWGPWDQMGGCPAGLPTAWTLHPSLLTAHVLPGSLGSALEEPCGSLWAAWSVPVRAGAGGAARHLPALVCFQLSAVTASLRPAGTLPEWNRHRPHGRLPSSTWAKADVDLRRISTRETAWSCVLSKMSRRESGTREGRPPPHAGAGACLCGFISVPIKSDTCESSPRGGTGRG